MSMQWAHTLIDQLILQGISYFCLSPGSRCTSLALAIANHPKARAFVHFDERGMAFHALGYAKAAKKPAVIVVTSGTAVGNLMPAVMEAHHAFIPLIILSSDRPPELRDNGANQSCDQVKLFGSYVRMEADLPCVDRALPHRFLSTTVGQAVLAATHSPRGPVHLNCMFREPFFSPEEFTETKTSPTLYEKTYTLPEKQGIAKWAHTIGQIEKGVIVIGSLHGAPSVSAIYALAEKLHWPILADITSNARGGKNGIAHYEWVLKKDTRLEPEAILHFGDRLVSKTLTDWLNAPLYCLVADHPFRHDPKHRVTHRIPCDPALFCELLFSCITARAKSHWLDQWISVSNEIQGNLTPFFMEENGLSEPGVIQTLKYTLDASWTLFIANSMPIRDADLLFFSKEPVPTIFANRGLSGIDGNIGTAVGIAAGCQKPTVALIGDQAALHDLNSIAQIGKSSFPIILIVINNGGGGIFSFLPVAEKTHHFEQFFAAAHDLRLEKAAELFHLPYTLADTQETWEKAIRKAVNTKQSCLIEVMTDRRENVIFHKRMNEAACSATPAPAC